MFLNHRFLATSCLLTVIAAGCGSGEGPEIVPVSGIVSVDGAPAAGVQVNFEPVVVDGNVAEAGPRSAAATDAEGRYELRIQTGDGRLGARVGEHTVTVIGAESDYFRPTDEDGNPIVSDDLPTVEIPQAKAPLIVTVPPGGTDSLDIAL